MMKICVATVFSVHGVKRVWITREMNQQNIRVRAGVTIKLNMTTGYTLVRWVFNPFTPRVKKKEEKTCTCNVVLTFEPVDEILWCDHSNDTFLAVLLHGTICFAGFEKKIGGFSLNFLILWPLLGSAKGLNKNWCSIAFSHFMHFKCLLV